MRRVLAAAVLVMGGCSSIQTTDDLTGRNLTAAGSEVVAHIHSDIWGIYFLGFECMPVITGSRSDPGNYHFFRDTVSTNSAASMVTEKSKELGADTVTDLTTDWSSEWQTFTLIFWLKEAQASGNAVIVREAPPEDSPGPASAPPAPAPSRP